MADASQLLEAVRVLYHAPDDAQKRAASAWLEDWQASPGAWDLAAAVLRGDGGPGHAGGVAGAGVPVEARYLAAQTLRTKVRGGREGACGVGVSLPPWRAGVRGAGSG